MSAWFKRHWKAVLVALATVATAAFGPKTVAHKVGTVVLEVAPQLPDGLIGGDAAPLPSPADLAKP